MDLVRYRFDSSAGLVAGAAASVAVLLLVWARLYLCLAHYWCVPASSDACGSRWSLTRYSIHRSWYVEVHSPSAWPAGVLYIMPTTMQVPEASPVLGSTP